ncbi:uncharacterized protein L3040_004872 [Drepanopeziza brunnea f. sp. 'multigermtubi']|uniref:uncharacterized protein n=1 Tax=Drepanopeziza brunnea f. sp. 'multigermtubi' TaxID=698441 RepID=UPI00238EB416|nr:hypothetical protein L3040_004872 [Drepanopeziza brunnea f. sp. 'multigermtubi']
MELNLVVPVPIGELRQPGDEEINGRLWRVTGAHDPDTMGLKFHCVSYVWGPGVEPLGSFFGCKREISDQTRPALTAAIKAADVIQGELKGERTEAFWIDAICIPQLEVPARYKTLESMGFIYNAATSVIIVLKSPAWRIVEQASAKKSPEPLSYDDMHVLETDTWISRVWTYQELVNGRAIHFTSPPSGPDRESHVVVEATQFFNCIGHSLARYKRETHVSESTALATFPNLNVLEDTLLDSLLSGYLERPALGILCNISTRSFDAMFPQNRLLACLGALTKEPSWGPPSDDLGPLSEKMMGLCERKGDYSFVFTADERSLESGRTWRPDTRQASSRDGPKHLVPLINWPVHGNPVGETQRGRTDEEGFWLEKMVPLRVEDAMRPAAKIELDKIFWGWIDPRQPNLLRRGLFGREEEKADWLGALAKFLVRIGYKGCLEPHLCETGLFFSQKEFRKGKFFELFAAASLGYYFGAPGIARWRDGGKWGYCAGVFVGLVSSKASEPLLIL